jgi:hypothetical protein
MDEQFGPFDLLSVCRWTIGSVCAECMQTNPNTIIIISSNKLLVRVDLHSSQIPAH